MQHFPKTAQQLSYDRVWLYAGRLFLTVPASEETVNKSFIMSYSYIQYVFNKVLHVSAHFKFHILNSISTLNVILQFSV